MTPAEAFDGSLLDTVEELAEECAAAGLEGAQVNSKLHRLRSMAVLLDVNPNQPALLNQFRSVEQDVERLLPVAADTAFDEVMAELARAAEEYAQ